MLQNLWKYLNGYVKIKVEGYAPERFFNLCNVRHILLWGMIEKKETYEVCISCRDFLNIRPLVRKTGTKVTILKKQGIPFFFHRFRKRKMFFGGMLFCTIAIYILSLFVWNIHLEGNVTQSTEELLAYMETLGVRHGVLKSGIVCEAIETGLRKQYPNLLWVSAEMRGTRILVQVKENSDKYIIEKPPVKSTDAMSMIADTSGVIESMIVRSGTPLVSVGDQVEAGQILVEGFYAVKNDAGEVIRYEGTTADADIFVHCEIPYTDQFSTEYRAKTYTKRKRLGLKFSIFNKSFELKPKIPFESYDQMTDLKELHVTENFYFPCSVELNWYLEYHSEVKNYDTGTLKALAMERFSKKYENNLQKGVQIIEKDVKIDTNGKLCRVTGTVKLLIPVTTKIPAVLPETTNIVSLEGEH